MDTDTDMAMPQKAGPRPLDSVRAAALAGPLALALMCMPDAALAQSTRVTPTFDSALSWTDNAGTDRDGAADWLLEVSPGLSVSRTAGRLNGSLRTRLRNLVHSSASEQDSTYLSFNGNGSFEAVEDLLFLDFRAGVSRNNYSSFSGRAPGDPFGFDKDNEVRYWSVAPRLESDLRFGEAARGSVRYSSTGVRSNSSGLGDQRSDTWNLTVGDPGGVRFLGWGVAYSRTDTTSNSGSSASGERSEESVRGTLYANLSQQLRLRGIVGHESNDYANGADDSSGIVGGGFDWYPTDRTAVSATVEDRVFGRGYSLDLSHRMRRAVFFVGASRDVSSLAQSLGYVVLADRSCVELVADPDYRPEITDPLERQQLLLDCLSLGLLNSNAAYVQRSVRGGFSLLGVRNTLSFSVSRSDRSRLSGTTGLLPGDELLDSERVRTTTATLGWSHVLTGTSSLTGSIARSESESQGGVEQDLRRLTGSLGVSRALGPRTSTSLVYRYQKAEGNVDYTSNAITATLGMRF